MAIFNQYIFKALESKFLYYNSIREAVKEARVEQLEGHFGVTGGNNSGHSKISDPTAAAGIKRATPLKFVKILHDGSELVIYNPEAWLQIMNRTYAAFDGTTVDRAMARRYEGAALEKIISDFHISTKTFYNWRSDFLTYAAVQAVSEGLIKLNQGEVKQI